MKTTIIALLLAFVGCGEAMSPAPAPAQLTAAATPPQLATLSTQPLGPGSMSGWWRGELDGQLWTASFAQLEDGYVVGGIRKGEWLANGEGPQWDLHGQRFGSTMMGNAMEWAGSDPVTHPVLMSLVETLWIGIDGTSFQVTFVAAEPRQ